MADRSPRQPDRPKASHPPIAHPIKALQFSIMARIARPIGLILSYGLSAL
jgi:hypothetical protein